MTKLKARLLIMGLLVLTGSPLLAADTLFLDTGSQKQDLSAFATLFVDASGQQSFAELLDNRPSFQETFSSLNESKYPEVYWLRIPIRIMADSLIGHLVSPVTGQLGTGSVLEQLDVFIIDDEDRLVQRYRSGWQIPLSQRNLESHPLVTAIRLDPLPRGSYIIYARLQNHGRPQKLNLALEWWHPAYGFPQIESSNLWLEISLWGMFLIIGLYVLVFYYYVRDQAFLFFGLSCLLYSLGIWASEPTYGLLRFLSEKQSWYSPIFHLHLFSVPCLMLFGEKFIDLKKHFTRVWYQFYHLIYRLLLVVVSYYFIRSFWLPRLIFQPLFFFTLLLLIPVCIKFLWSRHWLARLFAAAFLCFLGGNLLSVLAYAQGVTWGSYILVAGLFSLLFLFAIGLGYRLMLNERDKAEADKIRELETIKSNFFTNISHEFRTPLSLILGPLQRASHDLTSESKASTVEIPLGQAKTMQRNALRLQALIDQILELAKLESGKLQLKVYQGKAIGFIRQRVNEFKDIAATKNIHLISQYGAEEELTYFDPDKLEKILTNILGNAIKYTPAKESIHLTAKIKGKYLELIVRDTGPGMTTEETDKIFERFYRSTRTEELGSGLGMALVKELVDLHQGQLQVESQLGVGTQISCQLRIDKAAFAPKDIQTGAMPRQTSQRSIPVTHLEELTKEEAPPIGSNPQSTILLIEDNADLGEFIKDCLTPDYQLLVAADGDRGLDLAEQELPDVIISDIMMPGLQGDQLCAQLKDQEKTSHIPIILLTAKANQLDRIVGLDAGADAYLTKPFDPKELELVIKNLLQLQLKWKERYARKGSLLSLEAVQSLDEQFLQQVAEQIKENLANEYYSVEDLAKAVGYSRSQLFRKLKALTGRSPLTLIKEQRLYWAKELLSRKAATVSETAYQVGYSNLSYFSQSFKKEFGCLPSEV